MSRLRDLWKDTAGASLVEATLILPILLVMTFGLMEFGHALWQYNAAEKATAEAARFVATRGPVVTFASDRDCFVTSSAPAGTLCANVAGATGWKGTWSGKCAGTGAGATCQQAMMDQVVGRVRAIAPFVQPENVQVELSGSNFGFVGRGRPVPNVTVRLVNMTYNFVAMDKLLGIGPIAMPGFDATSVAEDQQEGGLG